MILLDQECRTWQGHLCHFPFKFAKGGTFLTGCIQWKGYDKWYCALKVYSGTGMYTDYFNFEYGWDWCYRDCTARNVHNRYIGVIQKGLYYPVDKGEEIR